MAIPSVYTWPAQDSNAICSSQSISGAGQLIINGTLSEINNGEIPPFIQNTPVVVFKGYARSITINSFNDLSEVSFTITGYYNGSPVSVYIQGPPTGSVSTNQYFDSVTSVSTDSAATLVSVGTGVNGHTNWYRSNNLLTPMGMSIQVVNKTSLFSSEELLASPMFPQFTYTFETTLDNVETAENVTTFTPISSMINATSNKFSNYLAPAFYSRIAISNSNELGTWQVTFVEQGIK